jgi:hypothetical protein
MAVGPIYWASSVQSTSSLFKNHFSIILSTSSYPKWCRILRLLEWNFNEHFTSFPDLLRVSHLCYISHPSHPLLFGRPDSVRWRSSSLYSFLQRPVILSLLGPKILLKILFLDTLSVWRFLNCHKFNDQTIWPHYQYRKLKKKKK